MGRVIKEKRLRMEEKEMTGQRTGKVKEKVILSHRLLGFERVSGNFGLSPAHIL